MMNYQYFSIPDFFSKINTSEKAIELIWKHKYDDKGFVCSKCGSSSYYILKERPEVVECKDCSFHNRLRVGTIFENSNLSLLTWVRSIYLMMSSKKGISALDLQRQLEINTYRTALTILRRVRSALTQRDEQYKLKGVIEFDGTCLGKKASDNQEEILVAVEVKEYISRSGSTTSKAGFAKVLLAVENTKNAQSFVNKSITPKSNLRTDGSRSYGSGLKSVKVKSKPMYNDPVKLNAWLPWIHKFISNLKSWLIGTHHGVTSKYFKDYIAEYAYRYNRRHDVDRLFSRALFASCSICK
jgi:hypothetical protein